jgi:hypothetical protein
METVELSPQCKRSGNGRERIPEGVLRERIAPGGVGFGSENQALEYGGKTRKGVP